MPATLAEQLEPDFVSFDVLEDRYGPMLALVRELIGVVPNCDTALEMWRPGFRTYNLLVPGCLNLPASLFGRGAPKDLVGLGMYTSSRAAECAYCSAHTCSYALRRGATTDAITGERSAEEAAVVRLSEGMARIPADLEARDVEALNALVGADHTEEIALGVALMGFLNKFMDAMGIELEPEAIADVSDLIGAHGWSAGQHLWSEPATTAATAEESDVIDLRDRIPVDNMKTFGRILRQGPGAARLERLWTRGIPSSGAEAVKVVEQATGVAFPLLAEIQRGGMVRALGAALRDNLDPSISAVGMRAKALAGWVYAHHVMNEELIAQAGVMIDRYLPELDAADRTDLAQSPKLTHRERAAVSLAIATAPSPAQVDSSVVQTVTSQLNAAEIVELTVWLSVQQLLHRYRIFVNCR